MLPVLSTVPGPICEGVAVQVYGVTQADVDAIRCSPLVARLQAKLQTSSSLAQRVFAKIVPFPGGILPVQDGRAALNQMAPDCVPVRPPKRIVRVVVSCQCLLHREHRTVVATGLATLSRQVVQDDKTMATLLCAFDPLGSGDITASTFMANVLRAAPFHPRHRPAGPAESHMSWPPTADHFKALEQLPSWSCGSIGTQGTAVEAHACKVQGAVASISRCAFPGIFLTSCMTE